MSEEKTAMIVQNNRQLAQALTANEIRAQVNRIQEVMKAVMKRDIHYGIIPGCPKPSLYKAGAEKIAVTFQIAIRSTVEDLSTLDEAKFKTTCDAYYGDKFLGSAVGICSSNEEKYKWRKPVCDEEFNETPEDRRRVKWAHGKGGVAYQQKQIRTQPADIANTVLQMSDKRGYVAVVRKVTAASDVFTQDIQDLPPEMIHDESEQKSEIKPPRSKSAKKETTLEGIKFELITETDRKHLFATADESGVTTETLHKFLKDVYKIEHTKDIRKAWFKGILEWVKNGGQNLGEKSDADENQ